MRTAMRIGVGLLCTAGAAVADGGDLQVSSLLARFGPPPPGIETFAVSSIGMLRMEASFDPAAAPDDYDPRVDALRVAVGGVPVVEGPGFTGSPSARIGRDGEILLRLRRPYADRGALSLRLDLAAGRIALDARGIDLGLLLSRGPGGVPVSFRIGDADFEASLDMAVLGRDGKTWAYRAAPARDPRPEPLLPDRFEVLGRGDTPGFREDFALAVRDADALRRLWAVLAGGITDGDGNPIPMPASWERVDFDRETVLAVGLAGRPTTGFEVEILDVRSAGHGAVVLWREIRPGRDCITGQAVTSPWIAVRVPRLEGEVAFRGTVVERPCRDGAEPAAR